MPPEAGSYRSSPSRPAACSARAPRRRGSTRRRRGRAAMRAGLDRKCSGPRLTASAGQISPNSDLGDPGEASAAWREKVFGKTQSSALWRWGQSPYSERHSFDRPRLATSGDMTFRRVVSFGFGFDVLPSVERGISRYLAATGTVPSSSPRTCAIRARRWDISSDRWRAAALHRSLRRRCSRAISRVRQSRSISVRCATYHWSAFFC